MITLERVEWTLLTIASVAVAAFWIALPTSAGGGTCRSGNQEARDGLKRLYVAQEVFRADHGGYTYVVDNADDAAYRFVVTDAYTDRFVGWAFRVDGVDDVWRITEQNNLEHVVDRCR